MFLLFLLQIFMIDKSIKKPVDDLYISCFRILGKAGLLILNSLTEFSIAILSDASFFCIGIFIAGCQS